TNKLHAFWDMDRVFSKEFLNASGEGIHLGHAFAAHKPLGNEKEARLSPVLETESWKPLVHQGPHLNHSPHLSATCLACYAGVTRGCGGNQAKWISIPMGPPAGFAYSSTQLSLRSRPLLSGRQRTLCDKPDIGDTPCSLSIVESRRILLSVKEIFFGTGHEEKGIAR
ncbi:16702_t:CDS:2, partial [Acaulospora colombiana]